MLQPGAVERCPHCSMPLGVELKAHRRACDALVAGRLALVRRERATLLAMLGRADMEPSASTPHRLLRRLRDDNASMRRSLAAQGAA